MQLELAYHKEGNAPLALWDCGTPLMDEEEKEHIDQIRAEQVAQRKILDDAARQRNFLIQSNAIVSLLPHATNGETWAQTGVAIRYLNGQGCETNKNLAIFWLQKAAAQGDSEASNYLARINSISTNAIPVGAP
ncbi:MAG TPA: SEL1-like repeat protein [Candidatus Paceibacterota bacterium]|nr:SEL1-like repeat protein [Candidatus Paceibacterota bacterium]